MFYTYILQFFHVILLTGSGPKGRGFESRHFDQEENPGSVRLPGFFFSRRIGRNLWKTWGKLGEGSGRVQREARKINDFRLGEMGEISTVDLAGRPGCRNQDLKMQLPAPSWRSGSAPAGDPAAGGETVRSAAEKCADDEGQGGWGKKNRDIFRASAPLKRRRTGRCVACRPEGAAGGRGRIRGRVCGRPGVEGSRKARKKRRKAARLWRCSVYGMIKKKRR